MISLRQRFSGWNICDDDDCLPCFPARRPISGLDRAAILTKRLPLKPLKRTKTMRTKARNANLVNSRKDRP
jgi:hypothetical protein